MESEKSKELQAKLKAIEPYPDYAESICAGLTTEEMKDNMLKFLLENPATDDVQILEKMVNLRGIIPSVTARKQ